MTIIDRLRRLIAPAPKPAPEPAPEAKRLSGFLGAATATAASAPRAYEALARRGYLDNPIAHRAVRMIAEAVAAVPLLCLVQGREAADHPALLLLARPQPGLTRQAFLETVVSHLMLSGNAYVAPVMMAGAVRELLALRPDRVSLISGADGWPAGHDYRAGATLTRYPASGRGRLLHLKHFHPLDDGAGYPPLAAAGEALELHNAATRWNRALIDNSARPSGALVYQPRDGGNLTPDQFQRLRDELDAGFSGAARAGRPMLLDGGLDWKAMGLSPREMDFAEAKNAAARDIGLALGVPPMLLGIPGDATYANYQEANRAFYRLTVLPLVNRLAEGFSAFLSTLYGEAIAFSPDLDQVAGLAVERSELWARLDQASFLSDAEKRLAVGYPEER